MCRFLCCSVQSVISPKLHTKKQPFNWPAPEGDILAQLHWLELLLPELDSRCWGPSADICHRLVETREFPGTYITCDYYVCFSVVSNSYHFRKRAHLLLGESEICPFLPLIRIVILTLYAPTPSAVLFLFSPCLYSVNSNRQALLKPRCDWQKSFSLISGISCLCYFTSPFVVFISVCILCHSHHSPVPSQSPWKGIEASGPFGSDAPASVCSAFFLVS